VLLLSAIFILKNVAQFASHFALPPAPPPRQAAPPQRALELEQAIERLRQPPQWTTSGRSGLFVPEKHFIGANGFPATLQTTDVHPPVPNDWLEQFGLPIAEADVLSQDTDNDGFNNLEKWQGHTDPTDPKSHPNYLTKLKLKSFLREPFRLVFASWVEDTYAINTSDLKEPTQFLKIGDTIRGTKFKVIAFTEKHAPDRFGTDQDVSELTLQNIETGEQIMLVKEKIMISPESVANFFYPLRNPPEFSVKKDQQFSLPPENEIKYKLIDVTADHAVLVNERTYERIEVGLLAQ
jgi:hypothetical protein